MKNVRVDKIPAVRNSKIDEREYTTSRWRNY